MIRACHSFRSSFLIEVEKSSFTWSITCSLKDFFQPLHYHVLGPVAAVLPTLPNSLLMIFQIKMDYMWFLLQSLYPVCSSTLQCKSLDFTSLILGTKTSANVPCFSGAQYWTSMPFHLETLVRTVAGSSILTSMQLFSISCHTSLALVWWITWYVKEKQLSQLTFGMTGKGWMIQGEVLWRVTMIFDAMIEWPLESGFNTG